MALVKNPNIAVPSIKQGIDLALKNLQQIDLDAPGYNEDTDGEIWAWVDWDQVPAVQESLQKTIETLQQLQYRITQKTFEHYENF